LLEAEAVLASVNPKRPPLKMVSTLGWKVIFSLAIDVEIDLPSSLPRMKGVLVSTSMSRTTESTGTKKF
jgi:hypothetical protein